MAAPVATPVAAPVVPPVAAPVVPPVAAVAPQVEATPPMLDEESAKAAWLSMIEEQSSNPIAKSTGGNAKSVKGFSDAAAKSLWLSKVDELNAKVEGQMAKVGMAPKVDMAPKVEMEQVAEEHSDAKLEFAEENLPGLFAAESYVELGEMVRVEVDVRDKDEDAEAMVWASASVCRIDARTGDFHVLVNEWASLPKDDPEFDEAYEDGPFSAAQENVYVAGREGRWRREPMFTAPWARWDEPERPGRGWWTQDDVSVTVVVPLPDECVFKRDAMLDFSTGRRLRIQVRNGGGQATVVSLDGTLSRKIVPSKSEYFVAMSDGEGQLVDGFNGAGRYLVMTLRKSEPRREWDSVLQSKRDAEVEAALTKSSKRTSTSANPSSTVAIKIRKTSKRASNKSSRSLKKAIKKGAEANVRKKGVKKDVRVRKPSGLRMPEFPSL